MARKTDGEKIDELEKQAVVLDTSLAFAKTSLKALEAEQARLAEQFSDFRRESEKTLHAMQQRIDDMRTGTDKWIMRSWALIVALCAVMCSYFLGVKK